MTHADAFLQDILAHPDDDVPRLIFADWLEEQGDAASAARAEFIRIQCRLATVHLWPSPPWQEDLERRQQQLLEEYGDEWVRPIRRLILAWEFHRGFIDEVTLFTGMFLAHDTRLFRSAPIQRLHLRYNGGINRLPFSVPALADSEHLRCLNSLTLDNHHLETRDVRALVVSEQLPRLTSLSLAHNRIGDGGIRTLAASPLLSRLTHLNLCHNDFGPAGVRALARALTLLAQYSPEGFRLRRLNLSDNNLGTAGQRVIADSPLLQRLTRE